MKNKGKFCCRWATICILLIGTTAFAHEIPTHKNITRVAVEYLQAKEPRFACATGLNSALQVGTAAEDDWPRFMFHFTPALNSGIYTATCSSLVWGFQSVTCTESGAPVSAPILNGGVSFSTSLTNEHTWAKAVANAKDANGNPSDQGWYDLGYVVHLLEDLTSPPHTRNDPHPVFDPFEKYNSGRLPSTPTGPLPSFSAPEDIFSDLQRHTQSNYYSSDTMFNPSLPGPAVVRQDYDYFYDARGRKIAAKGSAYRLSCLRHCDLTQTTIDRTIALEQFDELGPIAAQYAASLIALYEQQAGPALNAISNGGFEGGNLQGWTTTFVSGIPPVFPSVAGPNGPYVAAVTEEHAQGNYSARIGRWDQPYQGGGRLDGPAQPGAEPAGTDVLYQDVQLPANVSNLTLSFAYKVVTFDATIWDWLDAKIMDSATGATTLKTVLTKAGPNSGPDYGLYYTTPWTTTTADLTSLAGQKVRLWFGNHQDGFGDQNASYIDNVRLICR